MLQGRLIVLSLGRWQLGLVFTASALSSALFMTLRP